MKEYKITIELYAESITIELYAESDDEAEKIYNRIGCLNNNITRIILEKDNTPLFQHTRLGVTHGDWVDTAHTGNAQFKASFKRKANTDLDKYLTETVHPKEYYFIEANPNYRG